MIFLQLNLTQAQKPVLDSLFSTLAQAEDDTSKAKVLFKIGREFYNVSEDSVRYYYDQAMQLAENSGDAFYQAKGFQNYGFFYYKKGVTEKSVDYYMKAIDVLNNANETDSAIVARNQGLCSKIHMSIGNSYSTKGEYEKGIGHFEKSLEIYKRLDLKMMTTNVLVNIGNVYNKMGEYEKAIDYHQQALSIYESEGDKEKILASYANIALVHQQQENYDQAEEYFQKALAISLETGNNTMISFSCMGLGSIFYYQGKYEKAMQNYQRSMLISEEQGDKSAMARSYENIGVVHEKTENFEEATQFYQKAADMYIEIGDKSGMTHVFLNVAELSNKQAANAKNNYESKVLYERAIKYADKARIVASETGALPIENEAYQKLTTAWGGLGNYKKALDFSLLYIETRDSLINVEKVKALQEIETKYQTEKQLLQIDNLEKDKALQLSHIEAQAADMKRQRIMIYSFIAIIVIIMIFAIILFKMFHTIKLTNLALAEKNDQIMQQKSEIEAQRDQLSFQNEEIMQAKEEIEAQRDEIQHQRDMVILQKDHIEDINTELTDSIHYAKRIQAAILPREDYARSLLRDYFVLFRPKDIVSGDFYWMTHIEERTVVAAADCTGHGVPGAFMSMLGAAFLNEIVNKEYITHTGVILRRLRKEIIKALQQKGQTMEQKDGMDISLCSIDTKNKDMQFSGANNPVYIIRAKTAAPIEGIEAYEGLEHFLYEIKGDKMPIAIYEKMDRFETHEVKLLEDDRIYMLTDGYADQFGGPKGKKFKYKPLKGMLLESAGQSMDEQKGLLEVALDSWINHAGEEYEQVDDITIFGVLI